MARSTLPRLRRPAIPAGGNYATPRRAPHQPTQKTVKPIPHALLAAALCACAAHAGAQARAHGVSAADQSACGGTDGARWLDDLDHQLATADENLPPVSAQAIAANIKAEGQALLAHQPPPADRYREAAHIRQAYNDLRAEVARLAPHAAQPEAPRAFPRNADASRAYIAVDTFTLLHSYERTLNHALLLYRTGQVTDDVLPSSPVLERLIAATSPMRLDLSFYLYCKVDRLAGHGPRMVQ
jgi:hypothetical protein